MPIDVQKPCKSYEPLKYHPVCLGLSSETEAHVSAALYAG